MAAPCLPSNFESRQILLEEALSMDKLAIVIYKMANRFLQWLGHIAALLLPAGLLALSLLGASYRTAHAEATLSPKLAPDLANAVTARVLPSNSWAKRT